MEQRKINPSIKGREVKKINTGLPKKEIILSKPDVGKKNKNANK